LTTRMLKADRLRTRAFSWPFRFGIAHEIGALVLLSLIVFGTITGAIIRTKYLDSLREDLKLRGRSIAEGLARSLKAGTLYRDPAILNHLLEEFGKIHGIAYITVLGERGEVIAAGPKGVALEAFATAVSQAEGERIVDVSVPFSSEIAGSIHVGVDLGVVDESVENVLSIVLRIVLVSMACAMSVAMIVYWTTIRPIHVLTESVRQIGQGKFPRKVAISSRGELGLLARALEQMSEDLTRYHEQLEAKTKELELSKMELERQNEEIRRAQAQMIRSEKFASMGQLAASVAHEISNPLAGILTYLKLIRRRIESGRLEGGQLESTRQYLLTMEREAERCGQIVKNLLDFARSSEPDLRPIDIHRVLDETLFLLNYKLIMNDVVVEKNYGDVPFVLGDFGQLKQVFLNVIVNAIEAMKSEERVLKIQTTFHRESKSVLVEIQDTGEGISEKNIYRVFDPFFTTKPRGTGMGLAVVYGILEKHNADISIDSQVGKGTKVTVQLNVAHPER
jgi:two-component system NtrC family sensor kinase